VYSTIEHVQPQEQHACSHDDPLTCGYKYWLSASRSEVRDSWYLPADGAGAEIVQDIVDGVGIQYSGDGCAKVRWKRSTKRDRAGLWIWVCMRHSMVVGYHVMPKSEGLRDPIYSLFRFKERPPKALFMDFACGCEETALNWAPTMFKDTQFFHDAFHGMTHKCGSRYKSKRFRSFADLDTSLMEQVCRVCASLLKFNLQ
jgi:hypothetical protein